MKSPLLSRLKAGVALTAIVAQLAVTAGPASAFCGFYVAQADAKLFNKSSKVVLTRNGQQTAITMASDYEGEPSEFALVVPVPSFIKKDQISVVDTKTIDHLDAYTAPRLVEYFDPDPCEDARVMALSALPVPAPTAMARRDTVPEYRGVTVEARYDVAEYDVSILSAEDSDGLIRWLTDNGYKIPRGAEPVIGSYIKQKMHFFVAKVNLKRMQDSGRAYLRPLQVRYETAKFMLPLRLGTVNADGPQDLVVYALTKKGRIEASNYRTVKVPSDVDVPLFVKNDFANFYKATFEHAVAQREHARRVRRICLGHGLVRSLRRSADEQGRAQRAWRAVGRRRRRRCRQPFFACVGQRQRSVRDASARALRRQKLSRGSQFRRDQRPGEFPGPLHPAPHLDLDDGLRGRQGLPRVAAATLQGRSGQRGQSHGMVERRHCGADGGRGQGYFSRAAIGRRRRITPTRARRRAWP